jgi:hypothetical protein
MKKKSLILMLTLIVLGAASAKAQVTIGSENSPNPGAVLDLSQVSSHDLGLKLPAVDLSSVLVSGLGNSEAGLLVYNTYDTDPWNKGLYVWSGTTWVPAEQKPVLAAGVNPVIDFTVPPTLTVSSTETVTISTWSPASPSYPGVTWKLVSGGDKLEIDARNLTSVTVSKIAAGTAVLRATSVDGRVIHDIAVTVN